MTVIGTCLQYTEAYPTEQQAREGIAGLQIVDGYLGGRVLPPVRQLNKDCWRVQCFFDGGHIMDTRDPLPDGCRWVKMPRNQNFMLQDYPPKKELVSV